MKGRTIVVALVLALVGGAWLHAQAEKAPWKSWWIDKGWLKVYDLSGVCVYTNGESMTAISKRDLPEGTGCQ